MESDVTFSVKRVFICLLPLIIILSEIYHILCKFNEMKINVALAFWYNSTDM